ncbi:MAG: peroxidase [Planctomycetes bacterium]|nr:peroxidase [Planctomycetota bacterium]
MKFVNRMWSVVLLFVSAPAMAQVPSGADNNLQNPTWGAPGQALLRRSNAAYADGMSAPSGERRRSAREISNAVSAETEVVLDERNLSAWIYAWGQFVDHDLDLTGAAAPAEPFNIKVPHGDKFFDPKGTDTQWITLARSAYLTGSGKSLTNPRQQVNEVTAYLDGSVVYGSDDARAAALRTLQGGKLKSSPGNLLPLNAAPYFTPALPNANDAHILPDNQLFVGGDVRSNENIELLAVHVLWLREHNRICDTLANSGLSDDQIYRRARARVRALIQVITYREWLPALLGEARLGPYLGYNASTNVGIVNEFSTAALRLGHSQLGDDIEFLSDDAEELREAVALRNAFFNPEPVKTDGVEGILKYLATDNARRTDTVVIDDVRNFLFGQPGQGGFDLVARNIQRGRDHGLTDYNSLRKAYFLKPVQSFSQITRDRQLQVRLAEVYNNNLNEIDPWVGILAEDHLPGGSLGMLGTMIISEQFRRLRDGDRFWYEAAFTGRELQELRSTRLSDVIRRNTKLRNLQENVFFFDVSIRGRIVPPRLAAATEARRVNDRPGGSRPGNGGPSLGGILVRLIDSEGEERTVVTGKDGGFKFEDIHEPGTYTVAGGGSSRDVRVTRGGPLDGIALPLVKP